MKLTLSKLLIAVFSTTFFSSCGIPFLGSEPDKAPVISQPRPLPQLRQQNRPLANLPTPQNPGNNFSRDISSSTKITWNRGSANSNYIALTFDDGPVASNTSRLLDILKKRNVKATFYVIGQQVPSNQGLLRRMAGEGHEIGNHTWTHPNLAKLSDDQVRSELSKTRDAIVTATGSKPRTMRPPYGALRSEQRSWIFSEFGYPTIMWDVDPQDWKKPGSSVVSSRIISGTQNGSIILVHDLHSASVDAMPATVDALLRKGYKFVTVSQLIALTNRGQ